MISDIISANGNPNKSQKLKKHIVTIFSEDCNLTDVVGRIRLFKFWNVYQNDDKSVAELINDNLCDAFILGMRTYDVGITKRIADIRIKSNVPIIVVSESYDDILAITAFKFGADEYWFSNIDSEDMRNRILTVLIKFELNIYGRKYHTILSNDNDTYNKENDGYHKDHNSEQINFVNILGNDREYYMAFTPYEFKTLSILVDNAGVVLPRDVLAIAIRGKLLRQTDRSVDNIMARLRRKFRLMGLNDYIIRSFNSIGYIFAGNRDEFVVDLKKAVDRYLKMKNERK